MNSPVAERLNRGLMAAWSLSVGPCGTGVGFVAVRANIPTRPAYDWSVVKIYLRTCGAGVVGHNAVLVWEGGALKRGTSLDINDPRSVATHEVYKRTLAAPYAQ
eukprot:1193561-Prorocentrum_minimum.AAC.1